MDTVYFNQQDYLSLFKVIRNFLYIWICLIVIRESNWNRLSHRVTFNLSLVIYRSYFARFTSRRALRAISTSTMIVINIQPYFLRINSEK